jgi:Escherichia/Staphylococcus phage prohead protease
MQPNVEHRAATLDGVSGDHLTGHAIVFDTRSADLGGFVEIVKPSAVARALRSDADIVALYNHDAGSVLGRTPQTLKLSKDATGLVFDLLPAATTAGKDALELARRGDVKGASFGFHTITDRWTRDRAIAIRELVDIEIIEISLTAFPSYTTTDVSVAKRSMQKWRAATTTVMRQSNIAWLQQLERCRR